MKRFLITVLACWISASPANAADDVAEKSWQLALSGSTTSIPASDDQTQIGVSLTRSFGKSYVRASASVVDAGKTLGLFDTVSTETRQLGLAAGSSFGDISVDGYASFGQRRFKPEPVGPNGTRAMVTSNGKSFGAGVTLTYDVKAGDSDLVSPFLSLDYFAVGIGRVVTPAAGNPIIVKQQQSGVSGSAGIAYLTGFGADKRHSFSPYAALVVSSDSSAFVPGAGGQGLANMLSVRGGGGRKEAWADLGATASFALSESLRLRISGAQTLGLAGSDILSLSTGVSIKF